MGMSRRLRHVRELRRRSRVTEVAAQLARIGPGTHLARIARVLLGAMFLAFGLNGFHTFIPVPELHPFMQLLVSSGYIYLIKAVEVAGGLLLLLNRFVPLALVLLGTDIVNIAAYHALLDHRNWPIAVVNIVLFVIVLWAHRRHFRPLLMKTP
jgi:putative oxidoreductase